MSALSREVELTNRVDMDLPVGQSRTIPDPMDPERVQTLHATLAKRNPPPSSSDPLPIFWHQIPFWDVLPADELGSDGHVKIGGFIPDFGLGQRMWAGGRLRVECPLILGLVARKTPTIESMAEKKRRLGWLGVRNGASRTESEQHFGIAGTSGSCLPEFRRFACHEI